VVASEIASALQSQTRLKQRNKAPTMIMSNPLRKSSSAQGSLPARRRESTRGGGTLLQPLTTTITTGTGGGDGESKSQATSALLFGVKGNGTSGRSDNIDAIAASAESNLVLLRKMQQNELNRGTLISALKVDPSNSGAGMASHTQSRKQSSVLLHTPTEKLPHRPSSSGGHIDARKNSVASVKLNSSARKASSTLPTIID
jgi:hypothetical protein